MTKFYIKDYGLTEEQLDHKYNLDGDGQHPGYTRWEWRSRVAQECTVVGYWVEYQLEMEQSELDEDRRGLGWSIERASDGLFEAVG